jgi:AraC-like DNA-binding protein
MSKQSSEQIPRPLVEALKTRVIPWWQQWGMERCFIAPHDLENPHRLEQWLETGARISSCPYKGPRVAVKGPRVQNNRSAIMARWPKDKLQARRNAMFAIVIGGQTDFRIGDRLLHCSPGHSLVLLPGTVQSDGEEPHLAVENRQRGKCELLWISTAGDAGTGCWICHSEGQRHFEHPGESCHVPDPGSVALFEAFIREAAERQRDYRTICNHLIQALLVTLCREMQENRIFQFNHQKMQASQEILHGQLDNPVTAAREYMKNHLHQPLHIDDMARRFLLSRSEFTQRFKRETGQTFKQYLTASRMEEARRLLRETAFSIDKIAQAVGFDASRLRALFKEHHGMPPQQFRKQLQTPKKV